MYLLDGLHYNKYHVLESLGIYLCTSIQRYPVHCLVRHNLCQFMCLLQWSYMFPTTPILEDWEIMDASPSTKDTYEIWLQDWKKYLDGCSWDLQIPQKAQQIHTLLRPTNYHTSCNLKSANKNLGSETTPRSGRHIPLQGSRPQQGSWPLRQVSADLESFWKGTNKIVEDLL